MNLRNVTIWTTGAILVASIIAPYIVAHFVYGLSPYNYHSSDSSLITVTLIVIFRSSFLWLFSGSPLLVSFIIARKLKPVEIPNLILFASSIGYVLWATLSWNWAINGGSCMDGLFVLYIVPGSLLFMLPAWFVALLLNRNT